MPGSVHSPHRRIRSRSSLAAALASILMLAAPAAAFEAASREIIGFSEDGRFFAFEEYGIQDGSGFPYSNIYIIDVERDSWVAGTPVRVLMEFEEQSPEGGGGPLFETRSEARYMAADALEASGLAPFPMGAPGNGLMVVSNPITELSADPHFARFSILPTPTPIWAIYTLTVAEHPAGAPQDYCDIFGETRGFTLRLQEEGGGQVTLHADGARVPQSRQCPLSYAIADVVFYAAPGGPRVLAVLLSMLRAGFEGPDRRFLAVTAVLPD